MFKILFYKTLKGSFALIALSIFTFLIILFLQSCNKQNNYVEKRNLDVDLKLKVFKDQISKTKFAIEQIKKQEMTDLNTNSTHSSGLQFDYADFFVKSVHYPAIDLIRSYGISDQEIINEFGSLDSAKIVLTAESILATESLIDEGQTFTFLEAEDHSYAVLGLLGINTSRAETIGGCIADAVGVYAAVEVIRQGIKGLGKKGALKLLKKVASKYLGVVGVALAAYDFADCMNWI